MLLYPIQAVITNGENALDVYKRQVIQTPLGKLGIRAAPLHKAAQSLHDGFALVQIGLRQAGHLGDMVLQFAEDAGTQMEMCIRDSRNAIQIRTISL